MDKRILPDFTLHAGHSHVRFDDLLQRREVVLALLHGEACRECASFAQALRDAAWAREALVLVVGEGAGAEGIGLQDTDGAVSRKLRAVASVPIGEACLLIADRFGVLYAALPVHGEPQGRTLDEASTWLGFIQEQCPECGVPVS
ncbi:MAG: hypothetical protein ACK4N5_04230 [Myxococcales bacterium]